MARYILGGKRTIGSTFRDDAGTLADPTDVEIRVRRPGQDEEVATYDGGAGDVVRESAGVFSLEVELDAEGWWQWRVEGSGAIVAVDEGGFSVRSDYL